MNREIKFRGKREYNGEWIEGSLCVLGDTLYFIRPINKSNQSQWEKVIPETIGQFTGLHDKKGNEIYEGDMLKWWSGAYSVEGCPENVKKQADQTYREWLKTRDGYYDYESNGWYKRMNEGIVVFYGASFCIHNESDITNHLKNSPYNLTSYYGSLQMSKQYEITGNIHEK